MEINLLFKMSLVDAATSPSTPGVAESSLELLQSSGISGCWLDPKMQYLSSQGALRCDEKPRSQPIISQSPVHDKPHNQTFNSPPDMEVTDVDGKHLCAEDSILFLTHRSELNYPCKHTLVRRIAIKYLRVFIYVFQSMYLV